MVNRYTKMVARKTQTEEPTARKSRSRKVEATPVAEEPKRKVIKRVRKKAPEDAPPTTPVVETAADTPSETIVTPGGTRRRREVSAETVDAAFNELAAFLEAEIGHQRDVKDKNGGRAAVGGNIKFLRSSLKKVHQLQSDVRRVARKKRVTRQGNNNSGFLKKALISDEMADFLGLDHGSTLSRVECTKLLHAYILKHELQNPDNRREIIPDRSLTKLLSYNKKPVAQGGHGTLFYYVMQKLIQAHFVKDTPVS